MQDISNTPTSAEDFEIFLKKLSAPKDFNLFLETFSSLKKEVQYTWVTKYPESLQKWCTHSAQNFEQFFKKLPAQAHFDIFLGTFSCLSKTEQCAWIEKYPKSLQKWCTKEGAEYWEKERRLTRILGKAPEAYLPIAKMLGNLTEEDFQKIIHDGISLSNILKDLPAQKKRFGFLFAVKSQLPHILTRRNHLAIFLSSEETVFIEKNHKAVIQLCNYNTLAQLKETGKQYKKLFQHCSPTANKFLRKRLEEKTGSNQTGFEIFEPAPKQNHWNFHKPPSPNEDDHSDNEAPTDNWCGCIVQ